MRKALMAALGLLMMGGSPVPAVAQDPASWDGLVEVRSSRFEAGFLAPGADFRGYRKIMVDRPEVAFRNNWQRDVNAARRGGRRVSDQQAAAILEAAQTNFSDIFEEAFRNAGFEIATAPGPDVMRVSPAILNIDVNAPDTQTAGRSRSFTANAGQATLLMEVRDSETNALMARVFDRRETRRMPGQANSITNAADFRQLFRNWSRAAVRGLEGLKAVSPVPDPLTPGQRLN